MDPRLLSDLFKLASKYCEKAAKLLDSHENLSQSSISRQPADSRTQKSEDQERKKPKEKKESSKEKPKKPRKETGYNLYFKEKLKEMKESGEKIKIPECSKKISKEWNDLDQDSQDTYNNLAEEMNIVSQAMHELPPQRKDSSSMSDVTDSETNEPNLSKKPKLSN